jgi:signal peptidase I
MVAHPPLPPAETLPSPPRARRIFCAALSLALPGAGDGARPSRAIATLVLGAMTILLGGAGASFASCTCPLVASAAVYLALGAASALLVLRASRARREAAVAWQAWIALAALASTLGTFAATRAIFVDLYYVPTDSMEPTLRPGDTILVSHARPPARGDVAVFRDEHGRLFVKRIAGVAGDRVEIHHGELVLRGRAALHQYEENDRELRAARYFTRTGNRGHRVLFREPYLLRPSLHARIVPRGYVFVLGDSRDRSADSRTFGFVPQNALIGRAFALGPRRSRTGLEWTRAGMLL